MANAWRARHPPRTPTLNFFLFLFSFSIFILLLLFFLSNPTRQNPQTTLNPHISHLKSTFNSHKIKKLEKKLEKNSKITPFNCKNSPQSHPIIATITEGLKYPFIFSLADLGQLPENPNHFFKRILNNKPFRRPDISGPVQDVLGRFRDEGKMGIFVDVGANVGMASFAAAVMGFHVIAFEPVVENLQRVCDGIYFNRVEGFVTLFNSAVSDHFGNITFHKLVGRLDNSAVSAVGAKMSFKKSQEIAVEVKTIPLDDVIPASQPVLLLKIDVQGWEYHVLKGAKKLLSRKGTNAPYIIYEEDERLLKASNTTAKEIRDFLKDVGYQCIGHGNDAHCTKKN